MYIFILCTKKDQQIRINSIQACPLVIMYVLHILLIILHVAPLTVFGVYLHDASFKVGLAYKKCFSLWLAI